MSSIFPVSHRQSRAVAAPLQSLLEKLADKSRLVRYDWHPSEVEALLSLPLNDLLFEAAHRLRAFFDPNEIQLSRLLSIKTGLCPENCRYCTQSAHYQTNIENEALIGLDKVIEKASEAKADGATRFCMGAAFRKLPDKDLPKILEMVKEVKSMGMETCMTLGFLSPNQASALKESGLDYYNHNLNTAKAHYDSIATTHRFEDREATLKIAREAGLKLCSGGIMGMGEDSADRASFLHSLCTMEPHPESVPINQLIPMPGTPLEKAPPVDEIDFVRVIAAARILMPSAHVRLSAGRSTMSESLQALCFAAGANSVFHGECLLTAENPNEHQDKRLFDKLGLYPSRLS